LQLFAAYTVARRYKQIDCIEPRLQRRAVVFKNDSSARINMITTSRARKDTAYRDFMKCRILATFAALMAYPVTHFHDVIQTCVIIREAGEELANGKLLNRHDGQPLLS
jgi:hypothetical protein